LIFFYVKIGSFFSSEYETETKDEEDEEVIKKKKPHQTRNTSLGKRRSIGHIPAEDEESSVTEISSETEEPSISFSGCAPLSKLDDTHWFSDLNSGFLLFIFSRGINLFPSFTTRPILTGNGSLSGYRLG
jgi:hypothetical protein